MKKRICIVLMLALLLTGCGHRHSGGEWEADVTSHWKTCVCGDRFDSGKHTLDDNAICTVCGAKVEELTNGLVGYYVTCHDERGNPIRLRYFEDERTLFWEEYITYTYDGEGNVVTALHSRDHARLYEYHYIKGALSAYILYDADGTYYIHSYDSTGDLVSTVHYDSEGNVIE